MAIPATNRFHDGKPLDNLAEPSQKKVEATPDPISADAYHIARCAHEDAREASGRIVKHMWIIFVLLPIVLGILIAIAK